MPPPTHGGVARLSSSSVEIEIPVLVVAYLCQLNFQLEKKDDLSCFKLLLYVLLICFLLCSVTSLLFDTHSLLISVCVTLSLDSTLCLKKRAHLETLCNFVKS